MQYNNKTEELLYRQMLNANEEEIAKATVYLLDKIQQLKVHNQLLALGAALVCLIEVYNMSASDILGIAHNIVHNEYNDKVVKHYAGIRRYMRSEWNISNEWSK